MRKCMWRICRLVVAMLILVGGRAAAASRTDTAFWKPYAVNEHTYALVNFDDPEPLAAAGKLSGQGSIEGDARLTPEGRFGGGLKLDGAGYASFPTEILDPSKMWMHSHNRNFSVEAWIRLDRMPISGGRSLVVYRPDNGGKSLGFSLFVEVDGALGMRVHPVGGRAAEFKSPADTVPVGEWVHVAGISCGGHLSVGRDTLYVNGLEVYNGDAADAAGSRGDQDPLPIFVGGAPEAAGLNTDGFAGEIDEVRIHSRVGKLWPLDPMPWIERIAAVGMPPLDEVLSHGRGPLLTFHFDGDARPMASPEIMASDPAIIDRYKVNFKGEFVPGVKGTAAAVDSLGIGGWRLGEWAEGGMEFWLRPRGTNNVSDRNVNILRTSGLNVYFFNNPSTFHALSFYCNDNDGKLRMHGAGGGIEFHPGRWYHLFLAWDAENVTMYVNGERTGAGANQVATDANRGVLESVQFSAHFNIDELSFYEHRLTAAEVANRYWSYVDPEQIVPASPPAPIILDAWRLPSENAIYYRMKATTGFDHLEEAPLRLTDAAGREILAATGRFGQDLERLEPPPLAPGTYTLTATVVVDGKELSSEPVVFIADQFAWEGNDLGKTNEVFPPFEPVEAAGDKVSVVLREYRMNGFGLWDSVVSQGRELLAAPIRLRYETTGGVEGEWRLDQPTLAESQPHRAEYRARATSPAVNIEAVSEIEVDGMMKVTLTLKPGEVSGVSVQVSGGAGIESDTRNLTPETAISSLWLEIPVKASEATLMHEDTASQKLNYSGYVPQGEGTVWSSTGRKVWHPLWRNDFTGYVWVGGEERGIAWFAENDKGWITEKGLSNKPLQEIVRDGDKVIVRVNLVNLVNLPATINEPRRIVFGLQASPAKPMPPDWRTGPRGGGLPVNPWGGHQCADKFPFEDRWEIVDKIIEQQMTGQDNSEWFREFQKQHNVPPMRGVEDWLRSVNHFAGHISYHRRRPVLVYFEELTAPTYRMDWQVYRDEWSQHLPSPRRTGLPENYDGYDVFRQGRRVNPASRSNITASYRDYGMYYTNEWLKRGVGIYWDNTFLTTATNRLTTEAYLAEDGHTQPALTLWDQREYSRRTWNLTRQWERERGERLLFLQHMTGASLLPILAWTDTAYANEHSARAHARALPDQYQGTEPFPPDYIRAQIMVRQTGCYPALDKPLFVPSDLAIPQERIPGDELDRKGNLNESIFAQRREFGMCRVHEIPTHGGGRPAASKLGRSLRSFGYGTDRVEMHNYWAEKPALKVDNPNVKWLLVARLQDKRLMIILQNWSREPGQIRVALDFEVIGFRPNLQFADLESGDPIPISPDGSLALSMDTPYHFAFIGGGGTPPPDGTIVAEDFAFGFARWTGANSVKVVESADGKTVLRLGRNSTPWQGPARIDLWEGVDGQEDGKLEMNFQVSRVPEQTTGLLTVVTRAQRPGWSEHGLSHTRVGWNNGQHMELRALPESGQWEIVRWTFDAQGKRERTEHAKFAGLDDRPHVLAVAMQGAETKVLLDGNQVAAFADTPEYGAAFGIHGSNSLSDTLYVDLSSVIFKQ